MHICTQGRCESASELQLLLLYHFNRSIGNRLLANDSADYLIDKLENDGSRIINSSPNANASNVTRNAFSIMHGAIFFIRSAH